MDYEDLVTWATTVRLEGWDFGPLSGRYARTDPPWDYPELVRERLPTVRSVLDLGTGGGELLASLGQLPGRTAATEGYEPNVRVARRRLEPLGVEVAGVTGVELPFPDGSFDLVIDRHEEYSPAEVGRVLAPGGEFLTQQVGGADLAELNEALGGPAHEYRVWDLAAAVAGLTDAGFEITWSAEAHPAGEFRDIGAVVLFLRITPWHVPDFDLGRYEGRLRELHETLTPGRPLRVRSHRFALTARR